MASMKDWAATLGCFLISFSLLDAATAVPGTGLAVRSKSSRASACSLAIQNQNFQREWLAESGSKFEEFRRRIELLKMPEASELVTEDQLLRFASEVEDELQRPRDAYTNNLPLPLIYEALTEISQFVSKNLDNPQVVPSPYERSPNDFFSARELFLANTLVRPIVTLGDKMMYGKAPDSKRADAFLTLVKNLPNEALSINSETQDQGMTALGAVVSIASNSNRADYVGVSLRDTPGLARAGDARGAGGLQFDRRYGSSKKQEAAQRWDEVGLPDFLEKLRPILSEKGPILENGLMDALLVEAEKSRRTYSPQAWAVIDKIIDDYFGSARQQRAKQAAYNQARERYEQAQRRDGKSTSSKRSAADPFQESRSEAPEVEKPIRDLYGDLSVAPTASADEIKRNYRLMAMRYHPDRNPNNPEAEQKFKDAAEAYEVLSDTARRGRYDRTGQIKP